MQRQYGALGTNNLPQTQCEPPSAINEPGEALEGQFEFVDPHSGRPRPEPGSSGHIETISENLVVAPSGGGQQFGQQLNPYQAATGNRPGASIRQPQQQRPSNNQLPADLFDQRNSFVAGQGVAMEGSAATQQPNYFERLSSIELLFLISSLMFLVLLTLGLAGSFYCFRRQAHQRASGQRASAILKRKRRYLSPAAMAGPTLQQYQRQQQQRGGPLAPISASPSPGSDLSGRGLLAGSSSSLSAIGHPAGLPHYNRAYQPEPPSGSMQRFLASAGGHHYASQFSADAQPHQVGVRGFVRGGPTADSTHHKRAQPPVMGRRDTIYSQANGGGVPVVPRGQPARHQHPPRIAQTKLMGSTFAGGRLEPEQPTDGQPLLLLNSGPAHYGPQEPHHQYRGRPAMRAKLQHEPGLVSAQYALVNKPHQHHLRAAEIYGDQQQLWRAKSLSSVQQVSDGMRDFERKPYPIGGTLSRHKQAIGDQHRHHHLAPVRLSERELRRAEYEDLKHELQFSASSSGSCSESEAEPNNNNQSNNINEFLRANARGSLGEKQRPKLKPKPKILLKSIEDSYITNFTEIHEQEYMKRDTMRPLSMAAWRAVQPPTSKPNAHKDAYMEARYDEDRSGSERDREQEEEEEEQRYPSAQTNLRSLTELDVNFARLPESGKSSLRPTVSMDHVLKLGLSGVEGQASRPKMAQQAQGFEQSGVGAHPPERSNSVPDVGASSQADESMRATGQRLGPNQSSSSALARPQSPDLILSPDYDYDRLELKSTDSPSSTHNSVSYV